MKNILKFAEIFIEDKIYNFPKELYISEGLIKSYSYDELISLLKKLCTKYNITLNHNIKQDSVEITIYRKDLNYNEDFIEKFKNLLVVSGYHISNYRTIKSEKTIHGGIPSNDVLLRPTEKTKSGKGTPSNEIFFSTYDKMKLNLNKKYDTDIMEGVPIFLYHVTEEKNLPKIKKKGIIPYSLSKIEHHPDRVYLFDNLHSAEYYLEILNVAYSINDLVILKIDTRLTNQLVLRYDPKFYLDGKNIGAVYTDNHFSPVSIIDTLKY